MYEIDENGCQHPKIRQQPTVTQLGTLGTGNHFIEVCQDLEDGGVWFMLHSGSRGVGNRIGTYFIEAAKEQALKLDRTVKTDVNLAWLDEGTARFDDYVEAVGWAQRYARRNRDLMMEQVVAAVRGVLAIPFRANLVTVSCHRQELHRPRSRPPRVLRVLQPRSRPPDESRRCQAGLHRRGREGSDRGCRVPEGRRHHRPESVSRA